MCLYPVKSETTSLNLCQECEPAYASSPLIIAAHCSEDIEPVPESVSKSIVTSWD